jgi:hypothetical protein
MIDVAFYGPRFFRETPFHLETGTTIATHRNPSGSPTITLAIQSLISSFALPTLWLYPCISL